MTARVAALNRSDGGVPKRPVPEAMVTVGGMAGDRQRNLKFHGGAERALCLYAIERIEALQREGHPIVPGSTGENVTVEGLDWPRVAPAERLRLGAAVVEVAAYTTPCKTIRGSFADRDSTRISQERHPGWSRVYARVVREGLVRVGDPVELLGAPDTSGAS